MLSSTIEIRGARDLVALWRTLPVAVLSYPMSALPAGLGLASLSNTLREHAWREHCASLTATSCAEEGCNCRLSEGKSCKADVLFPVQLGSGAPSWRMATLFLQWRPSLAALHLIALGEIACTSLGWAARCLRDHYRLKKSVPLNVTTFADLELTASNPRWRLTFVTPWLMGKNTKEISPPDIATVTHELAKSLRARAHKFTALCSADPTLQRIGGHLVYHVANALFPTALKVEKTSVEVTPLSLVSGGNASTFEAIAWNGEAVLCLDPALLPWFSLLAICGGGENPDKGFGGIELSPLA